MTPDEGLTYRINAATEIWIRKVFPPTTGSLVRKDEPLAAYYTGAFLSAANAYLFALDTQERHRQTADVSRAQAQNLDFQMRQAVGNLINMGVSESQIQEMGKTRKVSELVEILYFTFSKEKDRAISLAEGLGRLVYCGFKILI